MNDDSAKLSVYYQPRSVRDCLMEQYEPNISKVFKLQEASTVTIDGGCEPYLKWSGKFRQRAKMYPALTTGYRNDDETQFFG